MPRSWRWYPFSSAVGECFDPELPEPEWPDPESADAVTGATVIANNAAATPAVIRPTCTPTRCSPSGECMCTVNDQRVGIRPLREKILGNIQHGRVDSYCHLRKEERSFRIDRIVSIERVGQA